MEKHKTPDVNLGAPEENSIPSPLVAPSKLHCYKPGDKLFMRKVPACYYDKRNISVVISEIIYSVTVTQVTVATVRIVNNNPL